ncbi:MAG: methyltransferase domain-containing protein [Janthinobacterium lividum]
MQDTVRANALEADWLSSFDDVSILSLDCFDTLLWRKVGEPLDVFYALAATEPFRRAGLSAAMRITAEQGARRKNWILNGSMEVTLGEIYRHALPEAGPELVAELAACELACEIAHCFVFEPTFELIRAAKARGAKVVVVSDTYFSSSELSRLLFAALPALEGLLDAVYTSSDFRLSKAAGIWSRLLPLWKVKPAQVLHLGDNAVSDLSSPQRFGIRAAHLVHQDEDTTALLRGREQAGLQLLPELRRDTPLPSLYHAQLARCREQDPARRFGYTALGPIMCAFADFIVRERARLAGEGRPVRLGFLLRDGWLPYRAVAALEGGDAAPGSLLNISRFTAIAATLDSRERIAALLVRMLGDESMAPLARQLLLPEDLAGRILKQAAAAARPVAAFAELVLKDETVALVMAASKAFRKRLVEHVRRATGVQPGDTLLFVDLGYTGTAQNLLRDVLKQDLGVDLAGAYLLADHAAPASGDRRGLLDAAHIDPRIIRVLTNNPVAALEMLCTSDAPSTVGYTEAGAPVHAGSALDAAQHAAVAAIQDGCLDFIAGLRALDARFRPAATPDEMARQVAIDLGRMLYFPTRREIDVFAAFQFDFNLGTDKRLSLFDTGAGLVGIRRQGMAYTQVGLDKTRTNYGMELRPLDLSLSTLLFAHQRYGFGIETAQVSYRQEPVQVLFRGAQQHFKEELLANATFDGYFSLLFPVSAKRDVAVLFGADYSWLQIDSVHLLRGSEEFLVLPGEDLLFDQMAAHQNGLFELGPRGMMFLPGRPHYEGMACRVVFRPVAWAGPGERADLDTAQGGATAAPALPATAASVEPGIQHAGSEFLDAEALLRLCGAGAVLHVGGANDFLARALLQRGAVAGWLADLDAEGGPQADCVVAEAGWLLGRKDGLEAAFARLRAQARRFVVVRTSGLGGNWRAARGMERAAWENAAIGAGFRRAPVAVSIDEYRTPGAAERMPLLLAFERIDDAVLAQWPLARLPKDRGLHMDMSRQSGARADAGMVRYALAAGLVRPGDTVLDCACGLGYGSAILAAQSGGARFIGIGLDADTVAYAHANFGRQYGVEYRAASATDLSGIPDDSIDLLVFFETIGRLEDYHAFLREARRVLRPDGRIVAGVPNLWVDETGRDPDPSRVHASDYPSFRAAVAEYFLVEERWAQTAPGGVKLPDAPRALHRLPIDLPDEVAGDTEWLVLVGSVDPLVKKASVGFRHPAFAAQAEGASPIAEAGWLVDFAQHFDNPWLYRPLVQMGERIRDRGVLLDLAARTIDSTRRDGADFGAALTVLAYAMLEEQEALLAGDVLALTEQYVQLASANPHVQRWQISSGYAAARLALALGERELARMYFGAVEGADFMVFSPLLATKTIASSFQLGTMALAEGDPERARGHFAQGVAAARRALHADDLNAIGRPDAPLAFGFTELAEVADMGAQCARALELLPLYARSPGQFWRRVDTRRFGVVSWAQAVERENHHLRARLGA